MKKISFKKDLTKDAASPCSIYNLDERLRENKAIDYRNNYKIKEFDDGYIQVLPIDKNKMW